MELSSRPPSRNCARIVVVNSRREVLMVFYEEMSIDSDRPELIRYWALPGGGLERHETFEQAAVRELEEETGIVLDVLGPCVWTRERRLLHRGILTDQRERYYLVHADPQTPLRNRTQEPITGFRWWSLEAMTSSPDEFFPERLKEMLGPILDGEIPSVPIAL